MDKVEIIQAVKEFFSKNSLIVAICFFLSLLNTYVNRKQNMKWYWRIVELLVRWIIGSGLTIITVLMTNQKEGMVIIFLSSAFTLGSEIIADKFSNILISVLDKLKDKINTFLD